MVVLDLGGLSRMYSLCILLGVLIGFCSATDLKSESMAAEKIHTVNISKIMECLGDLDIPVQQGSGHPDRMLSGC